MAKNQTIIVTGGAQGIGKCISLSLLECGYQVAIADIDREAGEECLQEFKNFEAALLFVETDVSQENSVRKCIETIVNRFQRIDGLINNAGIAQPDNGLVEDLSLENWHKVIQTNLTGCFLMSKYAIPYLRQSKGAIVNIASTRALQSEKNTEAYSASKGGIVALTHALAMSLGSDIRVNCISPGWIEVSEWQKSRLRTKPQLREIDHHQHPVGRVGKPEDVASMVKYLISDAAGFITGQNFVIDGGMTRKMIYEE
ncbi:SDR family oxidoreductase [Chlorogloeopsis sp. ULAP02]|uniref:SDR family oxidoreductase n=1 Tax=Chlorogloeopsis sp. ULAP02 TaxID=3107926 RepID=UPI0031363D79